MPRALVLSDSLTNVQPSVPLPPLSDPLFPPASTGPLPPPASRSAGFSSSPPLAPPTTPSCLPTLQPALPGFSAWLRLYSGRNVQFGDLFLSTLTSSGIRLSLCVLLCIWGNRTDGESLAKAPLRRSTKIETPTLLFLPGRGTHPSSPPFHTSSDASLPLAQMQDRLQLEAPYTGTEHISLRRGSLDGRSVLVQVATSGVGVNRLRSEALFYRERGEMLRGLVQPMVISLEGYGPSMLVPDSPPGWTPLESFADVTDEQANAILLLLETLHRTGQVVHRRVYPDVVYRDSNNPNSFLLSNFTRFRAHPTCAEDCWELSDARMHLGIDVQKESEEEDHGDEEAVARSRRNYLKDREDCGLPPPEEVTPEEPQAEAPLLWRCRYVKRG